MISSMYLNVMWWDCSPSWIDSHANDVSISHGNMDHYMYPTISKFIQMIRADFGVAAGGASGGVGNCCGIGSNGHLGRSCSSCCPCCPCPSGPSDSCSGLGIGYVYRNFVASSHKLALVLGWSVDCLNYCYFHKILDFEVAVTLSFEVGVCCSCFGSASLNCCSLGVGAEMSLWSCCWICLVMGPSLLSTFSSLGPDLGLWIGGSFEVGKCYDRSVLDSFGVDFSYPSEWC